MMILIFLLVNEYAIKCLCFGRGWRMNDSWDVAINQGHFRVVFIACSPLPHEVKPCRRCRHGLRSLAIKAGQNDSSQIRLETSVSHSHHERATEEGRLFPAINIHKMDRVRQDCCSAYTVHMKLTNLGVGKLPLRLFWQDWSIFVSLFVSIKQQDENKTGKYLWHSKIIASFNNKAQINL